MKTLIGQKAAILNSQGQILILKRGSQVGMPNAGGLDFPGGGLEVGEDPKVGIRREIKEETNLEVTGLKPFEIKSYSEDESYIVMIIYQAQVVEGPITLSSEHSEYFWLSPEQVLNSEIGDDYKDFVRVLISKN